MTREQPNIPIKIFLAEDDTDDRIFFDRALKEIPIVTHLTTFQDGEELMNFLLENSDTLPDILFLDLSMPRKTGFECLSEIKENDKLKSIPVIMFSTSYARDNNYEQNMIDMLYKIGAQNYIRKPGDFNKLKEIIHQTLIELTKKTVPNTSAL